MKKIGSNSYKNAEQDERNQVVSRFLEEDFIWIVSDRSEDWREVDGERVSLRFLSQFVEATQQKLWENTGLVICEPTFRKILLLSKHIKTYGKQNIETSCCRKCSELEKMISLPFLIFLTLENRSVLRVTHPIISRADFERLCG